MNLIREHWSKQDINEFQLYLKTFSKGKEKSEWEQRIVNTALPCIAVPSNIVKEIVKQISKGNFVEFIEHWPWENFTNTEILAGLICKIKDFETMKKFLIKYSNMADNWAGIDTIKITPKENEIEKYLKFSKELLKSKLIFSRRLGVIIMLKIISEKTIDEILSIINNLTEEKEYYVNMSISWLLAECFTKYRDKTLNFIIENNQNINKFVMNKAISKCRDSYRISHEDKEMLLKFRKK